LQEFHGDGDHDYDREYDGDDRGYGHARETSGRDGYGLP
jgi:hypothetical protein